MKWRRAAWLAFLAAGVASSGHAQGFIFGPVQGELGSSFDGGWFDFEDPQGNAGQQLVREWIRLRLSGAVLHPGLLGFDVDLRPMLTQMNFSGEPASPNGSGTAFTGGVTVRALQAARLSSTASWWRSEEILRGRFGAQSDLSVSALNVTVRDRNRVLPVQLEYQDESRDITFTNPVATVPLRTDQRTKRLRLSARNSKTGLLFERLSFEDRVANSDFVRSNARFDHLLRWGKGSRLTSLAQRVSRSGSRDFRRVSFSEAAHLQQAENFFSEYSYSYARQETPNDLVSDRLGKVLANYQITPNLRFSAEGYGESRSARAGTQSYYRVRPELGFAAGLPLRGLVNATLSAGYEWHDQTSTDEGLVDVVDEPHPIGDTGRFQLDRAFAEPSTLVVTSRDGAVVFDEGVDYRVIETGPFLEIVVLPGGRIQTGETVRVDYRFRIFPGATANAFIWRYELGLRLGGVRLYHSRLAQEDLDDVVPGVLPVLRNYDDVTTGATLNLKFGFGSLNGQVEQRKRRTDFFDFRTNLLQGGLGLRPTQRLSVILRGSVTAQRGNTTEVDIVEAESTLEWQATRALRLSAGVSRWSWTQDGREDDFIGGGAGLQLDFRQVRLVARYDRLSYENGFDRVEDRLYVRLTRAL